MSNALESLTHDLPPFSVAKGAQALGFKSPLDRPWRRVGWSDSACVRTLCPCLPLGVDPVTLDLAVCEGPLEVITLERFSLMSLRRGRIARVFLGQCPHCRTLFWALKEDL